MDLSIDYKFQVIIFVWKSFKYLGELDKGIKKSYEFYEKFVIVIIKITLIIIISIIDYKSNNKLTWKYECIINCRLTLMN